MKRVLQTLVNSLVDHPSVDYLAPGLLVLLMQGADLSLQPARSDRTAWYSVLATVSGVFLTLGALAITLVVTVTPGNRLERVIRQVGPRLHRLVFGCLTGLTVVTIGFAVLIPLDAPSRQTTAQVVLELLIGFGVLRVIRLWWLLGAVFKTLITHDDADSESQPASMWRKPAISDRDYEVRKRRPS